MRESNLTIGNRVSAVRSLTMIEARLLDGPYPPQAASVPMELTLNLQRDGINRCFVRRVLDAILKIEHPDSAARAKTQVDVYFVETALGLLPCPETVAAHSAIMGGGDEWHAYINGLRETCEAQERIAK